MLARTGSPGSWTAARIRRPLLARDRVRGDQPRSSAVRRAQASRVPAQAGAGLRVVAAHPGEVTRRITEHCLDPARLPRPRGRRPPARSLRRGAGRPRTQQIRAPEGAGQEQLVTGDRGDRQVQRGLAAGARDEAGLLAAWPDTVPFTGRSRRQVEQIPAGCVSLKLRQALQSRSVSSPQAMQCPQLLGLDARGRALPAASREPVTPAALSARAGGGSPRLRLPPPQRREQLPARRAVPGSRISRSPGSHSSTSQMMSRSSSRIVTGCPDHRFDIFPALITSPASASIRCSWEAFQISRWAAASRRFHFTGCRPRTGQRPGAPPWPRHLRHGCGERERRSSWC